MVEGKRTPSKGVGKNRLQCRIPVLSGNHALDVLGRGGGGGGGGADFVEEDTTNLIHS